MKKLFILVVAGLLLWMKPAAKKNILLIDIDILRADALPCYGYFRNTAPNICGLAKKSVLYKDNYANATWTLPSIFSTITSQYPTFHGVKTLFVDRLSERTVTLAETLKNNGYQTIFVGDGGDSGLLTSENGGLRGFGKVTNDPAGKVLDNTKNDKPWFVQMYRGDLHLPYLLPEGTRPMEDKKPPKNLPLTKSEYDLILNKYLKKHYQEVFKEKTIQEYKNIILSPEKIGDTSLTELFNRLSLGNLNEYFIDIWKPGLNSYMESFDAKNKDDIDFVRLMYDTKIKLLDAEIGEILKKVDLSKTIVVLMSDHGEAFGEHGTFAHEYNYHTELFKTPLIIWSPKLKPRVVEEPTSNIDIFPTILDLVGIEKIDGLQGRSVTGEVEAEKMMMAELAQTGVVWQNKDWLFLLPEGKDSLAETILHNKKEDPGEKVNVAKENPELVKELFNKSIMLRSYQDKKTFINETKIDDKKLKRMQREGYF